MPNIKPVSDLRNYNEVFKDIDVGQPVFLTKSGREKYAILDIREYEKTQAALKLMGELLKRAEGGYDSGWMDAAAMEDSLGFADE